MESAQAVITAVAVLVVCWLLLRFLTTGRKRRVSDYVKKFDSVDVSTGDAVFSKTAKKTWGHIKNKRHNTRINALSVRTV